MGRIYAEFLGGPRAVALLFLRLVAGFAMMHHGWPKIQSPTAWMGPEAPVPGILQALAAISEFGGGLAWVLGALTPLFSLGLIGTMAFATFLVHIRMGHPFVADPTSHGPSYEPALGYLAIAFLFLIVGPGRISVDYLLFGKPKAIDSVLADDVELPA
ncbi:DoxX family protein [Tundrisphaera lichenicola]|uniref:DoxX family protein n=1 Tax=Tundrisphaera lichenicola TaxID=2029860 RepID=UPI003EBD93EA